MLCDLILKKNLLRSVLVGSENNARDPQKKKKKKEGNPFTNANAFVSKLTLRKLLMMSS